MRFSLKWALAAMAYVALAAAAFTQIFAAIWASMLWAVTMLSLCYAVLVCCAWDSRRPHALGFVIASVLGLATLHFYPMYGLAYGLLSSMRPELRAGDLGFSRSQAAHAIDQLLNGLIGCGLGALAFRRGRPVV